MGPPDTTHHRTKNPSTTTTTTTTPPTTTTTTFRCSICDKTFGRAEHCRRHELIHDTAPTKQFQCSSCPKSFIRRDALQRHHATHQAAPSLLQTGGRACSACAAAKARCSGGMPCTRCRDRAAPCLHPVMISHMPYDEQQAISHPAQPPTHRHVGSSTVAAQEMPMADPVMFDLEAWEHNMLSSTNWLDVSYPGDYSTFSYHSLPFADGAAGIHPDVALPGGGLAFDPRNDVQSQAFPHAVHGASPVSVRSIHSSAVTDSQTSEAYSDAPSSTVGEYYVDGEPARLPKVKRRKTSSAATRPTTQLALHRPAKVSLHLSTDAVIDSPGYTIQLEAYAEIASAYQSLCVRPPAPWPPFEGAQQPGIAVYESLVGLYFKHFDPVLPLWHHASNGLTMYSGVLALAMAAVGAQYAENALSCDFLTSLHEFVRRWLVYLHEIPQNEGHHDLPVLCAEVLNLIGMGYHGDERLRTHALRSSHRLPIIVATAHASKPIINADEPRWLSWCEADCWIRLAYSAFLADTMLSYHFNHQPRLNLKDLTLPLPSPEKVWNAQNPTEWQELYKTSFQQQQTLQEALQTLYIEKRLARDTGELARVIIVHGLFHRQWEVEDHLRNPLSHWEPTAKRQSTADVFEPDIWLPLIPSFARWQNSACDCLDVFHWQANATIGQAKGLEHPTVMHLHLARIVLLAPHKDITELARWMTKSSAASSMEHIKTKQQLIRRWAVQHQYKARLAAIHAGVTLWHVRRYSVDAFYEAPAVALAALVLWAFGTFSNTTTTAATQQSTAAPALSREDSENSDDTACNIILLDRPTDDELVQHFIRNGGSMQAHITGVGDLYAPRGPERVLVQGRKLLSTLKCWGIASSWHHLLQSLENTLRTSHSRAM